MKKNFFSKLMLNKKTITNLNDNEMNLIRGATYVNICTTSCSYVKICCDPIPEDNQVPEKGLD